ncbi:MAG TPA: RHS repeat-associated core domain-containing protein [Candidatus Acidoferrum sp.]|jgi:RHS repeat-associated protein|nr:RHS repeat-associated core domain-containing protein [Candidatus Acidoferrum sp.]
MRSNLVGELTSVNIAVRTYLWGVDLSGSPQGAGGVGGLMGTAYYGSSTTNCFVAFDGNGNVAALVNAADGSVAAQYEYGPFGEIIRSTGPMAKANPFRFSTKYQDDETDLVYYGRRYYNANTGRWLSRDPSEENGGLNLYGFVRNDSPNEVDPRGLMRSGALTALRDQLDAEVRNFKCCCTKGATGITRLKLSATASGAQVTSTLDFQKFGCVDLIWVDRYFWWDCATAQSEYDDDLSPNKPTGRQAWQDYGWHEGGNPQTQSHQGWNSHWWDIWDMNHWNWQGAILYEFCGKNGHFHAALAFSNALEWTWSDGGWTSPHDGGGGTVR